MNYFCTMLFPIYCTNYSLYPKIGELNFNLAAEHTLDHALYTIFNMQWKKSGFDYISLKAANI